MPPAPPRDATSLTSRRGIPADAEVCGRICHGAFRAIAERHGRIVGSNIRDERSTIAGGHERPLGSIAPVAGCPAVALPPQPCPGGSR